MKKGIHIFSAFISTLLILTSCAGNENNEKNNIHTQDTLKTASPVNPESPTNTVKEEKPTATEAEKTTNENVEQSSEYSLCEAESGSCRNKCTVVLTKGEKVEIGSHIKVVQKGKTITEGYILKHISGSIFILKNKKDANDPEVCGGCCGEAYEINIAKKEIWTC